MGKLYPLVYISYILSPIKRRILFTSILVFFYFMRSLSMSLYFIVFTSCRFNGFYLSFWFLSLLSFVWIGGQLPVEKFISYGRILTLHYYFLLMCILFSCSSFYLLWPLTKSLFAWPSCLHLFVTFRILSSFHFHLISCLITRTRILLLQRYLDITLDFILI